MKNIIVIIILFLVIFLIYILSTKVRNNKLESFFVNSNCDPSDLNPFLNPDSGTGTTDDEGNSYDLTNMKHMCKNVGYEINSPEFMKKEENMFWGDCKQTALNDKDCYGFTFNENDLSGTNGTCTYYTVNQCGGLNTSRMRETKNYNASSGYSSVYLKSSGPCITKNYGYLTSSSPSNKGNISSYVNEFENNQNKYYNNIFENNVNSILTRDAEHVCYKVNEDYQICTSKKILNFTLDEMNPSNLYIYSYDDSFNYQIWYVNVDPNTSCFMTNQFTALTKPFKVSNMGSWNKIPIKMQVYQNNIYYSSVNHYIYKLSISTFNDTKIIDTSQAAEFRKSLFGSFRLFQDKIYFINNGFGGSIGSSTVVCYFKPGDPISILPYELKNHYQGNLKDFEIFTYSAYTMLVGLTEGGKLIMKSSQDGFWTKPPLNNPSLKQIYIDSREDPKYLYGLNYSSQVVRKSFKEIRRKNNIDNWESVQGLPNTIFRFKIYNINGVLVIIYIDYSNNDYSLHLKVLP